MNESIDNRQERIRKEAQQAEVYWTHLSDQWEETWIAKVDGSPIGAYVNQDCRTPKIYVVANFAGFKRVQLENIEHAKLAALEMAVEHHENQAYAWELKAQICRDEADSMKTYIILPKVVDLKTELSGQKMKKSKSFAKKLESRK